MLTVLPTTVEFTGISGTSTSQLITVSNAGTEAVTITSVGFVDEVGDQVWSYSPTITPGTIIQPGQSLTGPVTVSGGSVTQTGGSARLDITYTEASPGPATYLWDGKAVDPTSLNSSTYPFTTFSPPSGSLSGGSHSFVAGGPSGKGSAIIFTESAVYPSAGPVGVAKTGFRARWTAQGIPDTNSPNSVLLPCGGWGIFKDTGGGMAGIALKPGPFPTITLIVHSGPPGVVMTPMPTSGTFAFFYVQVENPTIVPPDAVWDLELVVTWPSTTDNLLGIVQFGNKTTPGAATFTELGFTGPPGPPSSPQTTSVELSVVPVIPPQPSGGGAPTGVYLRLVEPNITINPEQVLRYLENGSCTSGITVNPAGRCVRAQTQEWTTPSQDNAWWYDPARPASGEFLGALITSVEGMDSTLTRTPTDRQTGIGGGTLGVLSSGGRRLKFQALIFSNSCRGKEFGKRALINLLRGEGCGDYGCPLPDVEIWTCCPGNNDDQIPIWFLKEVGLVSGPTELTPPLEGKACAVALIEFELESESPWLYKQPNTASSGVFQLGSGCLDVCDWIWNEVGVCQILSPGQIGEELLTLTISSGDSTFSGRISVSEKAAAVVGSGVFGVTDQTGIPGIGREVGSYRIDNLPANTTLTLDGTRQKIIAETGGAIRDGSKYVKIHNESGLAFDFPSANAQCGDLVVCVYGTPSEIDSEASVTFQTVHREL
jgi:hypothetical protein